MEHEDLIWALLEQNKSLIEQNAVCLGMVNNLLARTNIPLISADDPVEDPMTYFSTDHNEEELGEMIEGEIYVQEDLFEEVEREIETDANLS